MRKAAGANATVTICHTGTKDISQYTNQADIVVAAIGRPEFVTSELVREHAVIIDVGVNRIEAPETKRGYRLVGDVDFELSGAFHLTSSGAGSNLTSVVTGGSNLDLTNFQVTNANVDLSGGSHATVKLDGRLDVQASGASSLDYFGEPTLGTINTSGASSINKR